MLLNNPPTPRASVSKKPVARYSSSMLLPYNKFNRVNCFIEDLHVPSQKEKRLFARESLRKSIIKEGQIPKKIPQTKSKYLTDGIKAKNSSSQLTKTSNETVTKIVSQTSNIKTTIMSLNKSAEAADTGGRKTRNKIPSIIFSTIGENKKYSFIAKVMKPVVLSKK